MSYLARALRPSRALAPSFTFRPATASFYNSSIRRALSESDTEHKDDPDRASKIDAHQKDSLDKVNQGKQHWKPELASNSEQGIKADKHDMSMEEMQKQGAQKAEEGKEPSSSHGH